MTRISGIRLPGITTGVNLTLLLVLWGDLFRTLSLEWTINEQYHYGYLVPFICGYLMFLRWEDQPSTQPQGGLLANLILWGVVLFLFPLKIVLESNPDWRMVYWVHALLVCGATCVVLWHWGGKTWALWFVPALAVMLFAVPWPTSMERSLILGLMEMVAAITVEILNLLGINAMQQGNLIQLSTGTVGVEEACSGVRSFQSTLMAAWFLGELFRFRVGIRIGLMLFGTVVSMLFNIGRTFLLTYLSYKNGAEFMASWHDSVGYLVSFLSFFVLLIVALIITRMHKRPEKKRHTASTKPVLQWLGWKTGLAMTVACLLSFPVMELWYRFAENNTATDLVIAKVDWDKAAPDAQFLDIPAAARAILRYSEGTQAVWHNGEDERWNVFFFTWGEGKISSFADIHNPEVCLPAAGFQLKEQDMPLLWSQNGLQMRLKPYRFESGKFTAYVFFTVWNDNQEETVIPMARTFTDRIGAAFRGERIKGRRSLEIIISGVTSLDEARRKVKDFLNRSIVVTKVTA